MSSRWWPDSTGSRSARSTVAGKPRAWKWSTGAKSSTVNESRDFDARSSAETISPYTSRSAQWSAIEAAGDTSIPPVAGSLPRPSATATGCWLLTPQPSAIQMGGRQSPADHTRASGDSRACCRIVAALGTDMARVGGPAQEAYRAQVERYLAHLKPLLGGDDDARRRATVTLSAMVGAVMIARALGPTMGSDDPARRARGGARAPAAVRAPARRQPGPGATPAGACSPSTTFVCAPTAPTTSSVDAGVARAPDADPFPVHAWSLGWFARSLDDARIHGAAGARLCPVVTPAWTTRGRGAASRPFPHRARGADRTGRGRSAPWTAAGCRASVRGA